LWILDVVVESKELGVVREKENGRERSLLMAVKIKGGAWCHR
jgi:hypothetical protein